MKTISREQLKSLLDSGGDYLLINVLGLSSFQDRHIPGSINVPVDDSEFVSRVETRAGSRSRRIVVYCGSSECSASRIAAQRLTDAGFTDVSAYEGGVRDWEKAGLPLERAMVSAST